MRISEATRRKTRENLLRAAQDRFRRVGFVGTTTREIARAAGIAVGTLFNYFPSKEALGMDLLAQGLAAAEQEHEATARVEADLEESLFAFIALQLRHLRPDRGWLQEVLEVGSSPVRSGEEETAFRVRQLERVERQLVSAGSKGDPLPLTLHLYWTLYLGVLEFWTRDASPNQEATLALLDRSMGLFVRGLREDAETESES